MFSGNMKAIDFSLTFFTSFTVQDKLSIHLPAALLSHYLFYPVSPHSTGFSLATDISRELVNVTVTGSAVVGISFRAVVAGAGAGRVWDEGMNDVTNTPLISYHPAGGAGVTYGPGPFLLFKGVSPKIYVNVTFPTAISGALTSLNLHLSLDQGSGDPQLHLSQGDVIELFLPQFTSDVRDILPADTGNVNNFAVTWIACEEKLFITVLHDILIANSSDITVPAIRLPFNGVNNDIISLITMSVSARRYDFVPVQFLAIEEIGRIYETRLVITPAKITHLVGFMVEFKVNRPLSKGDKIVMSLPHVNLTSGSCVMSSNDSFINTLYTMNVNYVSEITTTINEAILPDDIIRLNFSNCLTIPTTGFPSPKVSRQAYTVQVMSLGQVVTYGQVPFHVLSPVGLVSSSIYYSFDDISRGLKNIRISLFFTTSIQPDDIITIFLPLVNSTKPVISSLTLTSDFYGDAERYESTYFTASFTASSQTIVLTAQRTIPVRSFSVYVENDRSQLVWIEENNRRVTGGVSIVHPLNNTYEHYLTANISNLGTNSALFRARNIKYYPTDVTFIRDPSLSISHCEEIISTSHSENELMTCDVAVTWSSFHNITRQSLLVFSHEMLTSPDLTIENVTHTSNNVTLIGYDSRDWKVIWRSADEIYGNLSVLPHSLHLTAQPSLQNEDSVSAFALISADHPVQSADLTLDPIEINLKLETSLLTSSSLPRVIGVSVVSAPDSTLFIGDEIYLLVRFTAPVVILRNDRVRILLNTREFAHYFSGNGSSEVLFKYTVLTPRVSVRHLAVNGPAALTLTSFPDVYAALPLPTLIAANLTLPSPYDLYYVSSSGELSNFLVNGNDSAVVTDVFAYSGKNKDYSNGDVLDIAVVFNRHVIAKDLTYVTLSLLPLNTSYHPNVIADHLTFPASYVNVSAEQWLYFEGSGFFQLVYNDVMSDCISVDDVAGILAALEAFDDLAESLPVTIAPALDPDYLYAYDVSFSGIAPSILQVTSDYCPYQRARGRVALPDELYSTLIYRTEIHHNLSIATSEVRYGNVTYPPHSFIHPANNSSSTWNTTSLSAVVVANPLVRQSVNPRLPSPTALTALFASSRIQINNQAPYILHVTSDFTTSNPTGMAVSGDVINIVVTWSCPVVLIYATPNASIILTLQVKNILDIHHNTRNLSYSELYTRNITMTSYDGERMFFSYTVRMGDQALPILDLAANSTLHIDSDVTVYRKSRRLYAQASPVLPAHHTAQSLWGSGIKVNATELPTITRVYTNATNYDPLISSGVKTITVTAGTTLFIFVEFSSNITLHPHSSERAPFITFLTPLVVPPAPHRLANMTYVSTSKDSTTLIFSYTVEVDHGPLDNVTFPFQLQYGYVTDLFNRRFSNLSNVNTLQTIFTLPDVIIDTRTPTVLRVDCTSPDGIYYSGQRLDVFVVFDKRVYLLNNSLAASTSSTPSSSSSSDSLPSLKLFVETELAVNSLAHYSYGNGTNELHFSYVIPHPNINHEPFSPLTLDYGGVASLYFHLNDFIVTDVSPTPTTLANVILPIRQDSYLVHQRKILIDVNYPVLLRVFALRNGTYTAGDVITVGVQFTSPVMVFNPPPLLLLNTSTTTTGGVVASYVSGNTSTILYFQYTVQLSDSSIARMDYYDTRAAPYNTVTYDYEASFALVGFDNFYTNNIATSPFQGIYMASEDTLIDVGVLLPLPGATGSLSATSAVKLDLSAPFITKVTTSAPSGTYNSLTTLTVVVRWSEGVVVSGCPAIVFVINNKIRYATYNATTTALSAQRGVRGGVTEMFFDFIVLEADVQTQLDYYDVNAFKLFPCIPSSENSTYNTSYVTAAGSDLGAVTAADLAIQRRSTLSKTGGQPLYIKRYADTPTLDANLTLPAKSGLVTVISPQSIVRSGNLINMIGMSTYPTYITLLPTTPDPTTGTSSYAYSFGDVITLLLRYSGNVSINDPQLILSMNDVISEDSVSAFSYKNAIFSQQKNITDILFDVIVGPYDSVQWLTYAGRFALYSPSTNCPVTSNYLNSCAAQNLPAISFIEGTVVTWNMSLFVASQQDDVTPLQASITSTLDDIVTVTDVAFINLNADIIDPLHNQRNYLLDYNTTVVQYFTGQRVHVSLTFSEAVFVEGQPQLTLTYRPDVTDTLLASTSSEEVQLVLIYERMLSPMSLLFSQVIPPGMSGILYCGLYCEIVVEDVDDCNIYRQSITGQGHGKALVPASVTLPPRSCSDVACISMTSTITSLTPSVELVYSNISDVLAWNDTVFVFVRFSAYVIVQGMPTLTLDLPPLYPPATYEGYADIPDTLLFSYIVERDDNTNALDYTDVTALSFPPSDPNNALTSPGVYLASEDVQVLADITLPQRGAEGSLGRESMVVIDQDRPYVIAITAQKSVVTCGDYLLVSVTYSQPIILTNLNTYLSKSLGLTRKMISLNLLLSNTSSTQQITATLDSVVGHVITFKYYISASVSIGTITLLPTSVINLLNKQVFALTSAVNQLPCPLGFRRVFTDAFSVTVIKAVPKVVDVYSPNITTQYPFAAGDVIDIYVQFDLPVRVASPANLTLALALTTSSDGSGVTKVKFKGMSGADDTILWFQYTIQVGDVTTALEYTSTDALNGSVIYQQSSCEIAVVANATLPAPFALGSLGYCCRVVINSIAPYVTMLFPVKAPGVYGANEELLIVARFSSPVLVTGTPQLYLSTGEDSNGVKSVGIANYTTNYTSYHDLLIDFTNTDVVFRYVVQLNDEIDDIVHNGTTAIQTGAGIGYILQYSQTMSHSADLTLREPNDFTSIEGNVDRQWKYRFPMKIEFLFRDLLHNRPSTLTSTVDHAGIQSVLFRNCCVQYSRDRQFFGYTAGATYYSSGTISTPYAVDTTISPLNKVGSGQGQVQGEDLYFSDTEMTNIALSGLASQSSTIASATLAIDGGHSPLMGDASVSETYQENNAWWQVTLPSTNRQVQSILIYERLPEVWITPVVQYTIKGLDRYPVGYYKLYFTNIDATDASISLTTDFIAMRASADVVKAAIFDLGSLGTVSVTKTVLPLCDPKGNGCGQGYEHGLGDTYQLTFESIIIAQPIVRIVDIRYPGQPLTSSSNSSEAEYLSQIYPLVYHVDTVRIGYYSPSPKEYASATALSTGLPDLTNANEWLTPFWLFLFNSSVTVPTNINSSRSLAFWQKRYTSIEGVLPIVFSRPYDVATVKIQREGYGILSLTEVEIYSSALNILDSYSRGSEPIQPYELNKPYQPTQPLFPLYADVPYDGRWLVQLTQSFDTNDDVDRAEYSGAISDVILLITDWAGVLHVYYQDLKAVVTSLPRYGTLYTTSSGTLQQYVTWEERFGLLYNYQTDVIQKDITSMRNLGYCYGDVDNDCQLFPQGRMNRRLQLTQQVIGDVPDQPTILRNERVIYYVPDTNFVGNDFFSYEIYDGLTLQTTTDSSGKGTGLGTVNVQMVVDECRQMLNFSYLGTTSGTGNGLNEDPDGGKAMNAYFYQVQSLLCNCQSNMTSVIANYPLCQTSVISLCRNPDLRHHFTTICDSCFHQSNSTSVYSSSNFVKTVHCRGNMLRAVSLLYLRGLCTRPGVGAQFVDVEGGHTGGGMGPWSKAGNELMSSEVCLQTTGIMGSSRLKRPDYIAYQYVKL